MREQTKLMAVLGWMTLLVLALVLAGCGSGYRESIVDIRVDPGSGLSSGNNITR